MKKTYIDPTIEVITIATQQMLAFSVQVDETSIDTSEAVGREFNFDAATDDLSAEELDDEFEM